MATSFKNDEGTGIVEADGFDGPIETAAVQALTAISTADATDEATAVTLVNECKAKINAIIAALKG